LKDRGIILLPPTTYTGYRTFSENISEFAKINEMPIPLDIRRIDEGDGIEAAFIKNEAKYHESCRLMFNNTKLQASLNTTHPVFPRCVSTT
jgi:hypothetical protein